MVKVVVHAQHVTVIRGSIASRDIARVTCLGGERMAMNDGLGLCSSERIVQAESGTEGESR